MRGHKGNVGTSALLVEAIDAQLQIGWVVFVTLGTLVSPEMTGLFRAMLIVSKRYLSLDQAAETRATERAIEHLLGVRHIEV